MLGKFFIFGISFFALACSHGLEPPVTPAVKPGFGGTVYFSNWLHPPADSVYDIRVVAFYNYPPQDILSEVLSGKAKVYPPISGAAAQLFVDSLSYTFNLDSSATFQYVAVAMRDSLNLFLSSSWKVAGVYGDSLSVGVRKNVVVPANTFVNGINIYVDFKNPPPAPFNNSVAAK